MFVEFYPEPNNTLINRVSWVGDANSLIMLLTAMPFSITALVREAHRHFPMNDTDFAEEETHRQTLNKAITLADFMIEGLETAVPNRTFLMESEFEELLVEAFNALTDLQEQKYRTIERTHTMLGKNFGSATGFQKTDYHDVIDRLKEMRDKAIA